MRTVEAIINVDGSVTIKYGGFKGKACLEEALRLYERMRKLGVEVKVENVSPTAEMNVQEVQQVKSCG